MRKKILFCLIWITYHSFCFGQQSITVSNPLDSLSLKDAASILDFENRINRKADNLSSKDLIEYYKKGLNASKEIKDDDLVRIFADNIFRVYYLQNDMSTAVKYANIALDYSERTGDNRLITYQNLVLAASYLGVDNVTKAIEHYLKVIEISQKGERYKEYEYEAYMSMGYSFYLLGEIEESMSYLKKAERFFIKDEISSKNIYLANIYSGIAGGFLELENKDSSEFYINQTILALQKVELDTTLDELHMQSVTGDVYFDIMEYFLLEDRVVEANVYYEKIKTLKTFDQDRKYILDIMFALKRNELKKVEKLINTPLERFLPVYELEYLALASEYYEKVGDLRKSLSFLKQKNEKEVEQLKTKQIKFSSFTKDKIESINQKVEIERLIQDKNYQNKLTKVTVVVGVFMALSLLLLIYGFFQIRLKNKLLNKNIVDEKTIKLQAQKLQKTEHQKNKLFTNIAHEFQTPLNIIQGLSNRLYKVNQFPDDVSEALQIINKNSTYLSETTNQILSIGLLNQGNISLKYTLFSLPQLLEYILPAFQFLAEEKSITINGTDAFDSEVIIYSNLYKVSTVLKNILSNAIKYTSENGCVLIKYSVVDDQYHEVIIEDNGKGISKEELPYIFERYYQAATEAEGGFGLGLSICQEYIKSLNGKITVSSEVGRGTSFRIQIPQIKPETLPSNLEMYSFPKNDFPKFRPLDKSPDKSTQIEHDLLIVEDNIDFCKYLKGILKDEYNITFVHNGSEAFDHLENNTPTLILTDWMMQGVDGLNLVERLKTSKEFSHLPILMLTARSLPSDKIKALRVGIDDYLTKPVEEDILKKHIKNIIGCKDQRGKFGKTFMLPVSNKKGSTISLSDQDWLFEMEQIIFPLIGNFDLNLEQIADLGKTNLTQLNRKIKAITGLTAKKYIQEMRYWEARRMLETKEYDSVKAVCLSVGFKDQKNFSRKFKDRFGVYPSEYLVSS